jgi:ssRNA-specific RNase YbeY (16S rRNA maturation enzyme)
VGGAALIAGALVLGLVGIGAHAAPAVLTEGGNVGIPLAAAPISPKTATPSQLGTPMATGQPTPTAKATRRDTQRQQQAQPVAAQPKVPDSGPGTYVFAKIDGAAAGSGIVVNFDVRKEKNVPVDLEAAARTIQAVLNDRRSWRGAGSWEFQLVSSPDRADVHVYIVTPTTTDRLCAPLMTRGEVSCQNGNKVVLNAKRWVFGAETYGTSVANYRRYLVNHEFGHALGYQHTQCAGEGRTAGIMMQQTKGLDGCRANPWPYPKN